MANKFSKTPGMTIVLPPKGDIINDGIKDAIQHSLEARGLPLLTRAHLDKDDNAFITAIYINTSHLKKALERDKDLQTLLEEAKLTFTDLIAQRSLRLGSVQRSAPVQAARYIRKTLHNEPTFEAEQEERSEHTGERVKRFGTLAALATVIGSLGYVGGRAVTGATGLADRMASDITQATDISTGGKNDGLQKVIERKSGLGKEEAPRFAEKEDARREQTANAPQK